MIFVHAVYRDPNHASRAVDALVAAGFAAQDISALLCRGEQIEDLPVAQSTGIPVGAALGGLTGGLIGALVMGLGFSAGGDVLEQAARGWVAGAAFGLLIGVLGGLGYWRITLKIPKRAFREGTRILLGVAVNEGRVGRAKRALWRNGTEAVRAVMSVGPKHDHVTVRNLEH